MVVTRSTVVIHVPCYAIQPSVGFLFLVPLSSFVALLLRVVAPCVAVFLGQSLVHHCRHQRCDLGCLGIGGRRKSACQFGDVRCGCGGQGSGLGGVILGDSVEVGGESGGPGLSAMSCRYFLALYMKWVNSDQDDCVVWSSQSQSAMSNIPDFQMLSISIQRIVLSDIAS